MGVPNISPNMEATRAAEDDWDVTGTTTIADGISKKSFAPSCLDVFAGLWVFLYESSFPAAQHSAQQSYLLDELRQSTGRLRVR